MPLPNDPDLLTLAEGGELIGVSPHTIRNWIRQGRLPAYRFGHRTLRVRRAELLEMAQTVGTATTTDLDAHVQAFVEAAPALTEAQRLQLASLFKQPASRT